MIWKTERKIGMKLIIDISNKTYDRIKRIDKIYGIAPLNEYEIAIANGTPLEKELEKIKEEIFDKQYEFTNKMCSECNVRYGLEIAEIIIDKHIAELKGEPKIEKIDCNNTDCENCVNHNACDYEYELKGE